MSFGCLTSNGPGDVVPAHLTFARVQTCPNRQSKRRDAVADGRGAPDSARRPVERREEAVTRGVDFSAAEPF